MNTDPGNDLTATREAGEPARRHRGVRWTLCIAFAVMVHAAAFAALLAPWDRSTDEAIDGAPPILVELAQVTAAPAAQPNDAAPGPQAAEAQASPEQTPVREEPKPTAEPVLAAAAASDSVPEPEQKPEAAKSHRQPQHSEPMPEKPEAPKHPASHASAPSAAAMQARASAPAPGTGLRDESALPNWKSQLLAQLERSKRYPAEAQSRGDQGVALLSFSVDRHGGVHRAHIARSSGSTVLDQETLSLLQRAQPLPAPPADARGAQIAITVPIRYSIR